MPKVLLQVYLTELLLFSYFPFWASNYFWAVFPKVYLLFWLLMPFSTHFTQLCLKYLGLLDCSSAGTVTDLQQLYF